MISNSSLELKDISMSLMPNAFLIVIENSPTGCEINMQANLVLICAFGLIILNDINVWFCKAKALQQSDKCGEFMLA